MPDRPLCSRYLTSAGTGGGSLALDKIDGVIVKIKLSGPAASVMTVRVVCEDIPEDCFANRARMPLAVLHAHAHSSLRFKSRRR